MNFKKFFIIGAGPAGLACSYYLSKSNYQTHIFEQNKKVGGLARSWDWNGFTLDTGPHIFHTPIEEIKNDWVNLFQDLLIKKDFYACNFRSDIFYDYPLNLEQLSNFKEFKEDVNNLKNKKNFGDLAKAKSFEDYVEMLVGNNLAKAFFKEYPEKLWGIKTSEMSSEWAPKRIRLANKKEKFFDNEYTAIGRRGTGEVMERLSNEAEKNGCEIFTDCRILGLSVKNSNNLLTIDSIKTSSQGEIKVEEDDLVIITIPITQALNLIGKNIDVKFRGTLSLYFEIDKEIDIIPNGYDWLYFQNKKEIINRLCSPTEWSRDIDKEGKDRKLYTAEISVDYDIKPREIKEKVKLGFEFLEKLLNKKNGKIINSTFNLERYVYPVKTLNSKEEIARAKKIFAEINNVEILGTGANFNYGDMQIMFLKAKELSQELNNRDENSLSKISFIERYQKEQKHKTSQSRKIKIIAELGINHNGSLEELFNLIKEAANSGSQYIKFQHYKNEERVNKNSIENKLVEKAQDVEETTFEILEEGKLSLNQLLKAKKITEECGCIPMTTVFGIDSLKEAISIGFKNIKIASMDLNNFQLHKKIITYQHKIKDVFISTGMSSMAEIFSTLKIYKNSKIKPIVMVCTSAYPTSDEDLNLLNIKTYQTKFKDLSKDIGYSDHSIGNTACIVAASLGANFLEVHFTNSIKGRGPDHILSATPKELNSLRNEIDRIQEMLGSFMKFPRASEYETWRLQKKGLYAKNDISKGDCINLDKLEMKSPPYGILSPEILNNNFVAKSFISTNDVISFDNVSKKKEILLDDDIFSVIDHAKKIVLDEGKKLIVLFLNTKNKLDKKPFVGGFRESEDFIVINLVNLKLEDIFYLKNYLKDYADYIFLDSEKSSPHDDLKLNSTFFNFIRKYKNHNLENLKSINPSRITSEAAINLILNKLKDNINIGIIGLGSIGFRIAKELYEQNINLNIYSKNKKVTTKKVEYLKLINANPSTADIKLLKNISQICEKSDLVFTCSSQDRILTEKHLSKINKSPKEIIDIGKNNLTIGAISFCIKNNIKISRLDIGNQLIKEIDSFLSDLKRSKILPKRREMNKKVYVSGGFTGQPGDYVVDDADNPSIILGIINSEGKLQK